MGNQTMLVACPATVWSWHQGGRPESPSLHSQADLAVPADLRRGLVCPVGFSPSRADDTCHWDSWLIRESTGFQQLIASARKAATYCFCRCNYWFPPLWVLLNGCRSMAKSPGPPFRASPTLELDTQLNVLALGTGERSKSQSALAEISKHIIMYFVNS